MKVTKGTFAMVTAALLALVSVAGIAASDSPFLGSQGDPHGTLYLNVDQTANPADNTNASSLKRDVS